MKGALLLLNSITDESDRIPRALEILESAFGITPPPSYLEDIDKFKDLVSTWNEYASLISSQDLASSFPSHVADSLCLIPYIDRKIQAGYSYVDVGSGGGFPALPIILFRRSHPTVLIERNQRKAAFLTKAIVSLGLHSAKVIQASYPIPETLPQCFVLTARAIEKPDTFLKDLKPLLTSGSIFLRQAGQDPLLVPPGLRATEVTDAFDKMRLRRGRLYVISRPQS